MARIIVPSNRPNGRPRPNNVNRGLVSVEYGDTGEFGPQHGKICTGGTSVQAVLGPDAASNSLAHYHLGGTPTSENSLNPLMGSLRKHGKWVAGHLLNSDWGGKGDEDRNLTPLTSGANSAHKFYESHVKKMLMLCHNLDDQAPNRQYWYGVHYSVTVSPESFAENKDVSDLHSYCASHITLDYRFIKLPKSDYQGSTYEEIAPNDPNLQTLRDKILEAVKTKESGDNVQQLNINSGNRVSVEIHNTVPD
jgi:hypothetical protein